LNKEFNMPKIIDYEFDNDLSVSIMHTTQGFSMSQFDYTYA